MKINLNNRLLSISDFILSKDKVIDIGCDHGLLGIYLVLNKKIKKMVSSDINELPLKKAEDNIKKYNLEKKIETRLGNGLETVTNDLDTIIISGMGGLTMIEILKKINNYPNIKKIIISPNTDFQETRKFLTKQNFNLITEKIVEENKKYYLISYYEKGQSKRINYYFGKLNLKDKNVIDYYNNIINKNNIIIKKLSYKYLIKKINLIIENKKIKCILNSNK